MEFPQNEHKILKFWEKNKIFEKLRKKNQGRKKWSFLDGPITANNPMGVHHAWGRTYKDLFQRYRALQGFDQRFQNGFDCQGLWVEVEVEKEKGFKSKKDIEKFGIEKFVKACKERVRKYSKIQTEQSIRLGQWMDWKNSYYTMSDENNYAIWHFLKKCWEKKILYKGRDVVPWCPRCGTAISQHEILTEEYKEITHKAIFFKLPILDRKNTYFLAWTTTPWTLPGNVALAVSPDLNYAQVKDNKGENLILLRDKSQLIPGGRIVKTFKGKKLKGFKYKGLFDGLPEVNKSLGKYNHKVILWKDVSSEEGTGIVHIAPGSGQEDYQLSKELNLPVINSINDESKYRKGFGFLSGKSATDVNDLIFEKLTKKGLVFKIENYTHRYPTCWRCKSELIFRLVDEWYIAMDSLRKSLAKVAKATKWIPAFGLERELDWLKNMKDWLISKKRYWGLALPIYECKSCGNFEVIGSKEELKERAVSGWKEFEGRSPHRPWIDKVRIKCSKCNKPLSRILDVGNPWLDAGIVPFSTMKYFSDKDYWKQWFPTDLVCESFPGQFKNWFYAILVMSTVLENINPTKTIFGFATVVDEKGEEMHKSKGNAIWFDDAVNIIGADPMRWLYARQNIVYNLRFGFNVADEIKRKLLTLWNSFDFFKTYVSKNEFPEKDSIPKTKNILDKWIISRLNNLIEKTTRNLDRYNISTATLSIEDFFINDLSLWYIRRSRSRFQNSKNKQEKREAAHTLYYALLNLTKLIAPIMPFLAEEIYSYLKGKEMPQSVHLLDWPKADRKQINPKLEKEMKTVRDLASLALAQRKEKGIKVRQPLSVFSTSSEVTNKNLFNLLKEEINVEKIKIFSPKAKKTPELNTRITPRLKEKGQVRELIRHFQDMRKKLGLKPKHRILISFFGSENLSRVLTKNKVLILRTTKAKNLRLPKKPEVKVDMEKNININGEKLWLAIKKI